MYNNEYNHIKVFIELLENNDYYNTDQLIKSCFDYLINNNNYSNYLNL